MKRDEGRRKKASSELAPTVFIPEKGKTQKRVSDDAW